MAVKEISRAKVENGTATVGSWVQVVGWTGYWAGVGPTYRYLGEPTRDDCGYPIPAYRLQPGQILSGQVTMIEQVRPAVIRVVIENRYVVSAQDVSLVDVEAATAR